MKPVKRQRKVEKGTFDVEVDGRTESVEGKRVTKRKGKVSKFVAKGAKDSVIRKIRDKKKTAVNKSGESVVVKDKKSTKYKKNPPVKKQPVSSGDYLNPLPLPAFKVTGKDKSKLPKS